MFKSDIQAICQNSISLGFKSPLVAYNRQRHHAKQRLIPFDLTFHEWWDIWSNYYHNRGNGSDRLCMGRNNDSGGYTHGNVYICTNSQNNSDSAKFAKNKVKVKDGSRKLLIVNLDMSILDSVLTILKTSVVAAVRHAVIQCDDNCISTRSPTHKGGTKFKVENSRSFGMFLDDSIKDKAKKLGNGNTSEGIRTALKKLAQTL